MVPVTPIAHLSALQIVLPSSPPRFLLLIPQVAIYWDRFTDLWVVDATSTDNWSFSPGFVGTSFAAPIVSSSLALEQAMIEHCFGYEYLKENYSSILWRAIVRNRADVPNVMYYGDSDYYPILGFSDDAKAGVGPIVSAKYFADTCGSYDPQRDVVVPSSYAVVVESINIQNKDEDLNTGWNSPPFFCGLARQL